ncbi:MAG: hypothetical protein Q9218_003602 [Villophora microphyllina]
MTMAFMAALVCGLFLAYLVPLVLYRMYFHPLADYPGPKLAAVTIWYETWFDCVQGGKFSKHIDKLHKRYGNAIRINPNELHIRDPMFFDHFYTAPKLQKDPWYYNFAGILRSTFATSSADLHRQRRGAIAKAFATSHVTKATKACVERLITRLQWHQKNTPTEPVRMSNMFWMLASDVVTSAMMPRATQYVTHPEIEKAPLYGRMFRTLAKVALWNRHFSSVFMLLSAVPRFMVNKTAAPFLEVLKIQDNLASQIKIEGLNPVSTLPEHLHNSSLPPSDKKPARLLEEITMIIGAGTEAVGAALSITTYHILSNPPCLSRLRIELAIAAQHLGTETLPYKLLQQSCPYLTACIKEGLRLSKESNRMPRISSSSMVYGTHIIPAGVVVSMSLRDVHLHPSIFPNPQTFIPNRWLDPVVSEKKLDQYLVPFGRGSRACIGRAIAMEEMYVVLGNLFHRVPIRLFDTTDDDMSVAHDFFSSGGEKVREGGLKVLLGDV